MDIEFAASRIHHQGVTYTTARRQGQDIIIARGGGDAPRQLAGEQQGSAETTFPASYENMLIWERLLAPSRRLIAINRSGRQQGFGAGNRIVVAQPDVPGLAHSATFGGWDGIYAGLLHSRAPFWFIQQSIVRELLPEGADAASYPGIGHTGGYGPREFMRAGLFAFASLGGYTSGAPAIGADADHAIIVGYDDASLQRSLEFNKLAMSEAADMTKFTVDTSHLFNFPVNLSDADKKRLHAALHGRVFNISNAAPYRPGFTFRYDDEEIDRLGLKYWKACAVHKELYDHTVAICAGRPFDYELSLDETPEPTPPRDLLFYMVLLQDVMGVPLGGIAFAGPNIGFIKRHDYEGALKDLWTQVNACASILKHFGAMLSVHSADGVQASTGKGPGVDDVIRDATAGQAELKVADVYQEVLWQVLAASPVKDERELFRAAWKQTFEAVGQLADLYNSDLTGMQTGDVQRMLASAEGKERVARGHGQQALRLAQGTIGYGLPVFRLAAELAPKTDAKKPDPNQELFRRYMFLTFRKARPAIFQVMTADGWARLSAAIEEATVVRLRAMGWLKAG